MTSRPFHDHLDLRYGFDSIGVEIDVDGDASRDDQDALIAASTKCSAVFEILTSPTAMTVRPKT